jgi:hypothetical protein
METPDARNARFLVNRKTIVLLFPAVFLSRREAGDKKMIFMILS